MTAIDFSARLREAPVRHDLSRALKAGWQVFLRHRRDRRSIVDISRLSPHVIRDIGFEPEDVYGALKGSWDEVDPVTFRILLPRGSHL